MRAKLKSISQLTYMKQLLLFKFILAILLSISGCAVKPGTIQGVVWDDINGDGTPNVQEPLLSDRLVFLDNNENGYLDDGEPLTLSDENGEYVFSNLSPGSYTVSQTLPLGWYSSFPNFPTDLNPQIVGGEKVTEAVPWIVALLTNPENPDSLICGGSLIAEGWILSSARCVYRGLGGELNLSNGAQIEYVSAATTDEPSGVLSSVIFGGQGCAGDSYDASPINKVLLVTRGECSFNEKYQKAHQAGAKGFIVTSGEDEPFELKGIEEQGIFAIMISDSGAETLLSEQALPAMFGHEAKALTISPDSLFALIGELDLELAPTNSIGIQSVLLHPDWNSKTFEADMALIQLTEPIQQPQVAPLSKIRLNLSNAGTNATVMGWGSLERQNPLNDDTPQPTYPNKLRKVELPIISPSSCSSAFDGILGEGAVTETMLCAGKPSGGVDACLKDGGGPLFVYDEFDRTYQAGIVSWGVGCALPDYYGVYTRVTSFYSWAEDTLRDRNATNKAAPYRVNIRSGETATLNFGSFKY